MSVGQGTPSGGSNDAQAATVAALEKSGGGTGPAPQAQPEGAPPPAPQQQQNGGGLSTPFLEAVDPADRPVVEKYIKTWDAGVSKRFEELHGKLEPWEKLGAEPEQAEQAMMLLQMIDSEPERVLALLQEAIGQGQGEGQPQGLEGQQQPPAGEEDPMASLPPQFVEQFKRMEQVLETLAGAHLTQRQEQEQAQQDQELNTTLSSLQEKYGEFDEDYVLSKMLAGQEPEAAVQAYQKLIQGQVNQRSTVPNIPAILGGGGAAPAQQGPDIKKASSKDIRGLVANILAQSAQT